MPNLKSPKTTLYSAIVLFIILKIVLVGSRLLIWDEAVYITMGRFVWTLGQSGMWEILRPPLWPMLLGGLHITTKPIIAGILFMNAVAITSSLLTYVILKRRVREWIAVLTALFPLFFALNFEYSSYLLTGYLSGAFVLAGMYMYTKNRHVWTGILLSIALLTRFPAGIAIACFAAVYVYNVITSWIKTKKLWNQQFDDALSFAAPIILIIGCWLTANWAVWNHETQYWWHAAFRPLIYGSLNVFTENLSLYSHDYLYYIKQLLLFAPISILALFAPLKKHKQCIPLALTTIAFIIFFSQLVNQQWRFVLIILPGVFVLMALGAERVAKKYARVGHIVIITLFAITLVANIAVGIHTVSEHPEPNRQLAQAYSFLNQNPVSGSVIVNDPVFGAYIHNKIIPVYYETLPRFREALKQEHDAVVFVPGNFPCYSTTEECQRELTHVIDVLTTQEKLLYTDNIFGKEYYIFSDQNWFKGLSVSDLRAKYGLGDLVTLSQHPYDTFPITFVLEDFPGVDEKTQQLWREEQALHLLEKFANVSVTIAAIPTHHQQLSKDYPELISSLSRFEIAQNGLDHTGLIGTKQQERISQGRKILQDIHGQEIETFIPPYYDSNQETAQALQEIGYTTYVSTPGDDTQVLQRRIDQTLSLITNWENNQHKDAQQIISELEDSQRFSRYALTSIYYFVYQSNDSLQELDALLNYSQTNLHILTAHELSSWLTAREQTTMNINDSKIIITAPKTTQGLTILFRDEGNYQLESPIEVHIKNVAETKLAICINDVCELVQPNHFFLSRSPMVSAPPSSFLEN
jgi:Gpi18-like mannosyltransferase